MTPSFARRCDEIDSHARRAAVDGRPDARFTLTRSRLGTHALCDTLGVPHARPYHVINRHEIAPELLRRPCVLKPLDGRAGIAVMVLQPVDPGQWLDVRAGRLMSLDDIRARMLSALVQYPHWSDAWLIEQRLTPPGMIGGINEYQAFVFAGRRIEAVKLHRAHRGRTLRRWFAPVADGAGFAPVDVGRAGETIDDTLPPPPDPPAFVALARRVACALPFAFVRVDLMWTSTGYAVGEVNDHEGNCSFSPEWDQRLGAAWDAAETEKDVNICG